VVWIGVLWQSREPVLQWSVDGIPADPSPHRPLSRAFDGYRGAQLGVMTGLYDFLGLAPGSRQVVKVRLTHSDGVVSEASVTTTMLPQSVGAGHFTIMLASCFANQTDRTGEAGRLVTQIRPAPDLSLLVGDQVYLDQPLFRNWSSDPAVLAGRFEEQYVENWMASDGGNGLHGYARLINWAPSASIPDDHEYLEHV
jgi:hypothetical protein